MQNMYDLIRSNPQFHKLQIGDLLFAQYNCPIKEAKESIWIHVDCLVHVISGIKTWHTADSSWTARPGETLYFRKGASVVEQDFNDDFCLLIFYVPDALIRCTARELAGELPPAPSVKEPMKSVVRVKSDVVLSAFFKSMHAYFSGQERISEALLRLKAKELVTSLLLSGRNPEIAHYFRSFIDRDAPPLDEIMEANFRFNLSLQEFAKLCHRSLSSFKRDFRDLFRTTPSHWLLQKRLDHAAALFRRTKMNVTEILFESGFKDASHFSRVFRERFGMAPNHFRKGADGAE